MLRTNFMALCFIEPELLPIEDLHYRHRSFGPFWLLWSWPWPDNLHIRTWSVVCGGSPHMQIRTFYVKAFESYRLTDIQTDMQRDRPPRLKLYPTPLRGWSIIAGLSCDVLYVCFQWCLVLCYHAWAFFVVFVTCLKHGYIRYAFTPQSGNRTRIPNLRP